MIYPCRLGQFFAHQQKVNGMRVPENNQKAGQEHPGQKADLANIK